MAVNVYTYQAWYRGKTAQFTIDVNPQPNGATGGGLYTAKKKAVAFWHVPASKEYQVHVELIGKNDEEVIHIAVD